MTACIQALETMEGRTRSAARYKSVALTSASSIASKAVVLISTLVTVPITLHYLGAERYGLWMTITSFVLFLTSADFGLGNGLAVTIAEAHGTGNPKLAVQSISSAFFALTGIALGGIALFLTLRPWLPWNLLFNPASAMVRSEAIAATAVLFICTAINLPVGIVTRVQLGYQKGYISDLWTCAGNALAMAGVIFFVRGGLSLPWLVLSVAGFPVLATAVNAIVQFSWTSPWQRPAYKHFHWDATSRLVKLGILFFVQQCFGLTYYLSDNLVISHALGNAQVASFSVVQRLFSMGLLSQYVMVPLWPAFREAITRGDIRWARVALRRALYLNLIVGAVCSLALLGASRWVLLHWAGITVAPVDSLRIGFVPWVVLVGFIATMNAFLNQPHVIKPYLIIFAGATVISVVLKILLVPYLGITGAVWSTVFGYGFFYVLPSLALARKSLADLRLKLV